MGLFTVMPQYLCIDCFVSEIQEPEAPSRYREPRKSIRGVPVPAWIPRGHVIGDFELKPGSIVEKRWRSGAAEVHFISHEPFIVHRGDCSAGIVESTAIPDLVSERAE